jgi:hypothetical protein
MSSISDAWFYRLKAAQKDLIERCGGIERAAGKSSSSKSQVGRWNNPGDPDIMVMSAVLLLEADCGVPFVTTAMAELNGRRLADPDNFAAATGSILARHADACRQAADLMASGAAAFPTSAASWPARAEAACRWSREARSDLVPGGAEPVEDAGR